jgi:hypothetical protein
MSRRTSRAVDDFIDVPGFSIARAQEIIERVSSALLTVDQTLSDVFADQGSLGNPSLRRFRAKGVVELDIDRYLEPLHR